MCSCRHLTKRLLRPRASPARAPRHRRRQAMSHSFLHNKCDFHSFGSFARCQPVLRHISRRNIDGLNASPTRARTRTHGARAAALHMLAASRVCVFCCNLSHCNYRGRKPHERARLARPAHSHRYATNVLYISLHMCVCVVLNDMCSHAKTHTHTRFARANWINLRRLCRCLVRASVRAATSANAPAKNDFARARAKSAEIN